MDLMELSYKFKEELADLAHERWSGWMRYLFSKGTFNNDGSWALPQELVLRWKRQMETPYTGLTRREKNSDRMEADEILEVVKSFVQLLFD